MAVPAINLVDVAAGSGGFVIHGEDAGDLSGWSVASAGDVNGDGFDDLVIGAFLADGAGNLTSNAGDTYVVFGAAGGFGASINLATIAAGTGGFVIRGSLASELAGYSVASAGDVNGDGVADLIIGAPSASPGGITSAGKGYVVFGSTAGFGAGIDLSAIAGGTGGFMLTGTNIVDRSGVSVASAGDVNGDGFDDLLIGAPGGDGAGNATYDVGETYVVFGRAGGFPAAIALSAVAAGTGGFVLHGVDTVDRSGIAVASAGDVNGDGYDDLIIGAGLADGAGNATASSGESYVVFGKAGGFGAAIGLASIAAGTGGFVIHGEAGGDGAGYSVASAGDVNGDGFADVIIGARGSNSATGASYVVFGAAGGFGAAIELAAVAAGTGGFVIRGQVGSAMFGYSLASAGDVNGDGLDDLLIGQRALNGEGGSYVVFGRTGGFGAAVALADIAAGTGGFAIQGVDSGDRTGKSVSSMDLDGDGFDDLVISAPQGDAAGNLTADAGESYVIFGRDFLGSVTHLGDGSANALAGSAAADNMVGGRGDDTLAGAGGADVLIGGAGDDVLRVADLAFARAMGGSGVDTLALAGGGMTLDLAAVADTRLQEIERIDLTGSGNNTLRLTALEVLNLSPTGNALRVLGNAGDFVSFEGGGWERVAGVAGFATLRNGQAQVEVAGGVGFNLPAIDLGNVAAGTGGFVIYGEGSTDRSGHSVSSAGDVNGDGFDDLAIGAYGASAFGAGTEAAGRSYVVFGAAGGFGAAIDLASITLGSGGFMIRGRDGFDRSGLSVASAGDVNGDGLADLVVGASDGNGAGNASFRAGETYVVFGRTGGFGAVVELADIAGGTGGFAIYGENSGDRFGYSVASAGDLNGDGLADLIIGAANAQGAGNASANAGDVYVVFGRANGFGAGLDLASVSLGTGGFVLRGGDANDFAGASVATAGDLNGDGFADIIIGVVLGDGDGNARVNSGEAYVVFGQEGGFAPEIELSAIAAGTGGFAIFGERALDNAGRSVASAGDINGDGFSDLVIGVPAGDGAYQGLNNAGNTFVVFGSADASAGGPVDLGRIAAGTGGFLIHGEDDFDLSGYWVSSAGDVNADGFDDLIIGAPLSDGAANASVDSGDSYVVFGRAGGFGAQIALSAIAGGTGGFVIRGEDAGDYSGSSVASAGDIDGDGYDDLIIGAPKGDGAAAARNLAGDSYVIFGRDFLGSVTHLGDGSANALAGSAAADNMVGGRGNDTLAGAGGADVLIGGAGDDVLRVADLAFARAMGGSGADTLALDGAGHVLDLAAVSDLALQEIERIDLTGSGANILVLSRLEVLNLSSTSNTLRVLGNAGDSVALADGGWAKGASAGGFTTWSKGQASVEIAQAVAVGMEAIELADVAAGTGGFVLFGRAAGDAAGVSVAAAGDVNGDGFADLVIGAELGEAGGTTDAGEAYVVFGQAGGFAAAIDLGAVALGSGGFVLRGEDQGDGSGRAVASAGDVNGDGFADLVVGAVYGDGAGNAGNSTGDAYVVFGKAGGFGAAVDLSAIAAGSGGFVIRGRDNYDQMGSAVASAGDVNGDGFDDLIIGAYGANGAGNAVPNAGESYVVFGRAGGFGAAVDLEAVALGSGGFVIHGEGAYDVSGTSVSSAGDLNGDGFDDLAIGAAMADGAADAEVSAGATYVVFGQAGGFGAAIDLGTVAAGSGGFVIHGKDSGDWSGLSVASAGDVNGDGFADLVIGARYAGGATGDSYVVFGAAGGFGAAIDLGIVAAGTGGFALRGRDGGDLAGFSVASAGDVNGDGLDDLVIGASAADSAGNARADAGESYVVFGRTGGFGAAIDLGQVALGIGGFAILGTDAGDRSGWSVAAAGDVDGDGFGDIVVGAKAGDAAGNLKTDAGESYVLFGRDFLGTVTQQGDGLANMLTGSAAADRMVGGRGNDELAGAGGADVLIGGAGNDTLHIADAAFARVDGGGGTDTLALAGSGMALDLTAVSDLRLRGIERIDLTGTGNNALVLSRAEVLRLSEAGNTLVIDGNAGDSVELGTGWAATGSAGGYATYTNGAATVHVDTNVSVACFARGTRLRTARGEVAVEHLAEGDAVLTASGLLRRVRWVGHRTLSPARHPRPWDVQPVRVAADAFGPGMPARDLFLSPDHAVFAAQALIPVRYLLNGATIAQESVARVTYFHVELADEAGAAVHDVLLAEGMPCESYLDTGNRAAFANGGAATMLHPDFALRRWETSACAPLVRAGRTLVAVRAALAARARALGHGTTADPRLLLLADGQEVAPIRNGDTAHFVVPARARAVWLVSRTTVPAHLRPDSDDHRTLGVAVTCLAIDGCPIPLDDPTLSEGWHSPEPALRWTDGNALLPCTGGARVSIAIAPLEQYWLHPHVVSRATRTG